MIKRWPPLVWPLISLASLLILMGGAGRLDTGLLIAGYALALVGLAAAVYLALRRWPGRPRRREASLAMLGLTAFYVLCAIVAAAAGPGYAVAALAAGVIPLTALALLVASTRAKTADEDGRLQDRSAEAHDDPYPGIGMDDATPLGDTPEHSDADADAA